MSIACLDHLIVLFVSAVPLVNYTLVAPLFPLELERRALPSYFSALIFLYSPSYLRCFGTGFLASPFLSKLLLRKYGRLHSTLLLALLQSGCILSFGLSKAIPIDTLFIAASMLSRFV